MELKFDPEYNQMVEITWQDVETYAGWNPECGDVEPPTFTTVGYLVKEEEHKIIITDTKERLGNVTVFPRGVILQLAEVEF